MTTTKAGGNETVNAATAHGYNATPDFEAAVISDNAQVVLKKRYLMKDKSGELAETPDGMFRRVAEALAVPDSRYGASHAEVAQITDEFYQAMATLEYVPNSPTLMNAGTGQGTLSACFVLPLEDTMGGIMKAAHDAAMVQKFGGGTGFALSEIRPSGSTISTTHGTACGPINVLRHLSSVSSLVTQGGKRDGANMAVMDVHHPNILEFIECKQIEGEIHNFNISVGASDEFMEAVKNGTNYNLYFRANPADPNSPREKKGELNAREVFDKIVHGAWRNGEPGMIFLDHVNRHSPVLHLGRITATNPCGEQPLLPNESCNLGSIDVGKFVVTPNGGAPELDWERLGRMTRLAVHFLENTIDANQYAIPEIEEMNLQTRKIGLGVMGFADMLGQLGIPYDSEEGVEMGRKLMNFIMEQSDDESAALAEKRGPYPAFVGSEEEARGERPMRNACRLTVAPTGTISMIAGASSGIEPIFSLAFRKHNILGGKTLYYVDKNLERIARERGFFSDELMAFLADGGSLQDREEVPDDVKRLFHVAADIAPREHVLMQAAFQESTDAAISKTINFPNKATVEDVEEAYMLAWETACKGITIYRSGSREVEVLTSGHDSTKDKRPEDLKAGVQAIVVEEPAIQEEMPLEPVVEEAPAVSAARTVGFPQYVTPMDRPTDLYGITKRVNTGQGKMYVTVNMSPDGRPFEVFATLGKGGRTHAAMAEAVTRLASLSLRSGVDPMEVIKQLRGISSDQPAFDGGEVIFSGPDAIAVAMERILKERGDWPRPRLESGEHAQPSMFGAPSANELGLPTAVPVERFGVDVDVPVNVPVSEMVGDSAMSQQVSADLCPDCFGPLAHEEGCQKCHTCGFSKC
jgi:ribonucleoside-diphosphate reductase alpha chain